MGMRDESSFLNYQPSYQMGRWCPLRCNLIFNSKKPKQKQHFQWISVKKNSSSENTHPARSSNNFPFTPSFSHFISFSFFFSRKVSWTYFPFIEIESMNEYCENETHCKWKRKHRKVNGENVIVFRWWKVYTILPVYDIGSVERERRKKTYGAKYLKFFGWHSFRKIGGLFALLWPRNLNFVGIGTIKSHGILCLQFL